jgi:hypothetical protein
VTNVLARGIGPGLCSKVAIEKCDALAGDARSSCAASAKMGYGKT